jgi:hypothetical protein
VSDDLIMHAEDVVRQFLLQRVALGIFEQKAASLGLPVGKEHERIFCYAVTPEVLRVLV